MNNQSPQYSGGVKIISFCPLCGTKFNINNAQVVDEREDAQMIYINCIKCKTSVLAVIIMNNVGITSYGLLSDLSKAEVNKFKNSNPVTCDDVIEFHKAVKKVSLHKLINT